MSICVPLRFLYQSLLQNITALFVLLILFFRRNLNPPSTTYFQPTGSRGPQTTQKMSQTVWRPVVSRLRSALPWVTFILVQLRSTLSWRGRRCRAVPWTPWRPVLLKSSNECGNVHTHRYSGPTGTPRTLLAFKYNNTNESHPFKNHYNCSQTSLIAFFIKISDWTPSTVREISTYLAIPSC